jgi:tryptophanyl-tRNA synthetase
MDALKPSKDKVLTGIKPTGELHLGNYIGSLLPIIEFSKDSSKDVILMSADWHALTDKKRIREASSYALKAIAAFLCLGYHIEEQSIILQSDFPEILEIQWFLSTASGVGLLERAHAYKDALQNGKESTIALFNYPVLMAADILTFDSQYVPVGKDQLQHLEYASDMAKSFNFLVGSSVFTEPKPLLQDTPLLMGIDGVRKMSKSYQNEIPLFAPLKEIEKKVKEIKTDSKGKDEPKNPEDCLIYQIFKSFASKEATSYMKERLEKGVNYGYGHAKQDFLQEHERVFGTKRELFEHYLNNRDEMRKKLEPGMEKASVLARHTLSKAREALNLLSFKR